MAEDRVTVLNPRTGAWLLAHPGWKPAVNFAGARGDDAATEVDGASAARARALDEQARREAGLLLGVWSDPDGSARGGASTVSTSLSSEQSARREQLIREAEERANRLWEKSVVCAGRGEGGARLAGAADAAIARMVREEIEQLEARLLEAQASSLKEALAAAEARAQQRCADVAAELSSAMFASLWSHVAEGASEAIKESAAKTSQALREAEVTLRAKCLARLGASSADLAVKSQEGHHADAPSLENDLDDLETRLQQMDLLKLTKSQASASTGIVEAGKRSAESGDELGADAWVEAA